MELDLQRETMNNPQQAYRIIRNYLHQAGVEDAGLDAQLLIRHATQGLWFALDSITPQQAAHLADLARRRAARWPLHYLLGSVPFLDMQIVVGPGVLIPRPETEELCLYAAKLVEDKEAPKILDLCAGSGAISLGLQQKLPGADITAVEWDQAAFSYLEQNLILYKKSHRRAPVAKRADVLTAGKLFPRTVYDLIVCNPPYVTEEEYQKLEPELRYEPKQALVAGPEPTLFYEAVARDFFHTLKPGGFLVFEIGAGQGAGVRRILKENGFTKIWVAKDMGGHQRICKGQKA